MTFYSKIKWMLRLVIIGRLITDVDLLLDYCSPFAWYAVNFTTDIIQACAMCMVMIRFKMPRLEAITITILSTLALLVHTLTTHDPQRVYLRASFWSMFFVVGLFGWRYLEYRRVKKEGGT